MIDTYYIPQKNTMAAPETGIDGTLRQTVQEVLRAALPEIFNYCGDVHLNITLHIHCGNRTDLPEA
jgi:hypothetical protein